MPTHSIAASLRTALNMLGAGTFSLVVAGCADTVPESTARSVDAVPRITGTATPVLDSTIATTYDASGIADAVQSATLSTRLMGTVTAVLVHEGDVVRAGQPLVRLDASDLNARATQVTAAIEAAEAVQQDALANARRFRALYADSAATRAQFEAAETNLLRAASGVRASRASLSELDAMRRYATVSAPFAGIITLRGVDPGSFAAPGTPLIGIEDVSALRIIARVDGHSVRGLSRGQSIDAVIDGAATTAIIEGIVPGGVGNLFAVNAIVDNRERAHRAGSVATLRIPTGTVRALLVLRRALVTEGDLTGVIVRTSAGDERRWVRVGSGNDAYVEISSGLRGDEQIVVPPAAAAPTTSGR